MILAEFSGWSGGIPTISSAPVAPNAQIVFRRGPLDLIVRDPDPNVWDPLLAHPPVGGGEDQ
eukprot:10506293-Alexandrium_andersonii.AAC.1